MVIVFLVMVGVAGYLAYSSATAAAKNPAAATGVGKRLWRLMRKQPA